MRSYEASALIEADVAAVWATLTDLGSYTLWDSGLLRAEGEIAPG